MKIFFKKTDALPVGGHKGGPYIFYMM